MIIFLCRHGERIDQISKDWSKISIEPWNPPITTKGKEQIYTSVHKISNRGIESIIASPMRRTIESAEIASTILGIQFGVEVGLVEWQNSKWFDELKTGNFQHLKGISSWNGQYSKSIQPVFPEIEEQAQVRCISVVKLLLARNQKTLIIAHENGITGILNALNINKIDKVDFGEVLEIDVNVDMFKSY